MSDMSDDSGLPTAEIEQTSDPGIPTQQATPTGGEEAGKTAESQPESYVLDLGRFSEAMSAEDAGFLTKMAKDSGLDAQGASAFAQRLATYQETVKDLTNQEWVEASQNDKEYGGSHFDANLAIAKRGMEQFASPELKEMLNDSFGNHPEVIRLFYRIGKAIAEDNVITGRASASREFDARMLFPNSQMNP